MTDDLTRRLDTLLENIEGWLEWEGVARPFGFGLSGTWRGHNVSVAGVTLNWWYHAPRLALQPALVWWALYCSGVVDWPWSAER